MGGCVNAEQTWTLEQLQALPQVTRKIDIHCVTRWSKLGMSFTGIPLSQLLQRTGPTSDAKFISFVALGKKQHSTSLPLSDALELDSLVALQWDGGPLPVEHGGPVRMIVPGRYFYKSLKWLSRIELLAEDRLGYWEETAGYHNLADPWTAQRFVAARVDRDLAARLIAARDLSGQSLTGIDLGGYHLPGLQARRAILRDARFTDCQLQGACFEQAGLANAHFRRANLQAASFRGADVEGVDFAGADLRQVDLDVASLLGVSFVDASEQAILDETTRIPPALLDHLAPAQASYVSQARSSGR